MDPGKIYSGAESGRLQATDRVTWKIGHGEETRGPFTGGEGSLWRTGGLACTQAASQTQGKAQVIGSNKVKMAYLCLMCEQSPLSGPRLVVWKPKEEKQF